MYNMPAFALSAFAAAQSHLNVIAARLVAHMVAQGHPLDRGAGELNLIYVEGVDADLKPNKDSPDGWNDMGGVLTFVDGAPCLLCWDICTTEPGYAATHSNYAKAVGGVARMQIGYHSKKWRVGYHKQNSKGKTHPALVQAAEIFVYRDANKDGKRTGDPIKRATGINHHSTRDGYDGNNVGMWSAGCLVRKSTMSHDAFMWLIKQDPRYIADNKFLFSAALLDGSKIL